MYVSNTTSHGHGHDMNRDKPRELFPLGRQIQ